MIQPPQQENKCAKRRQQSQCMDFGNYPSCIKRVDHVRMHFDTAHLLSCKREWREPFVSKTLRGKTNQDNLIFELSRIGAAFENSPRGYAGERVLVTSESNVYGLRANEFGPSRLLLKIRFKFETGRVKRLDGESRDHASFSSPRGENLPADAVKIRFCMNVPQQNPLLRRKSQRLAPQSHS